MNKSWQLLPARTTLALMAAVAVAGCAGVDVRVRDLERRVEASKAQGAALDASFRDMAPDRLVAQLQAHSAQGIEPFNSRAYQETLRRGRDMAPILVTTIDSGDRRQLLSLLALRQIAPEDYAEIREARRVEILVDDLQMSEFYNRWGIPHLYWEDAGNALIDLGEAAVPALLELLRDDRPAPVWGDEEATIYRQYQYRVSDYAWALLKSAQGEPPRDIPQDPQARDRLIEEALP